MVGRTRASRLWQTNASIPGGSSTESLPFRPLPTTHPVDGWLGWDHPIYSTTLNRHPLRHPTLPRARPARQRQITCIFRAPKSPPPPSWYYPPHTPQLPPNALRPLSFSFLSRSSPSLPPSPTPLSSLPSNPQLPPTKASSESPLCRASNGCSTLRTFRL